ncbi:MAG: hypothetical protein HY516_05125 [Candidatus Aenigmarchaeota archaeon]|nr:hypothetical protein [Candidatus Aenigmarchaeota archaeon]
MRHTGLRPEIIILVLLLVPGFASASYTAKISLTLEKPVYSPSEQVVLFGSVYLSNLTANDTSYQPVANASVNVTIYGNSTGMVKRNYTINASAQGVFKSNSSDALTEQPVTAPAETGSYYIEASYSDPDSVKWHNKLPFVVLSQTIDDITMRPSKSKFYAAEPVTVFLEAVKRSGGSRLPVSNVSLNGTLRSENLALINQFNCTTGSTGVCSVAFNAPSTTGKYVVEANNFLGTGSFYVIPFNIQVYMKDGLGQNYKEVFRTGEDASVEVRVDLNGSVPSSSYTFNGTITNSGGSTITNISSTLLESNNSYTNKFTFAISNQFTTGNYLASVTVYDNASRTRSATAFFQVRDWTMTFNKASSSSGFEYEYVAFPGRRLNFEIYPKDRQNGSIITGLNASQFNITLANMLGSALQAGNATWNATCGGGCYTFNLTAPATVGDYIVAVSLNHSSDTQKIERKIIVTSLTLPASSTTETGAQKDLFGTTEPVYLTLAATNTTSSVNLTDASVINIKSENGTELNYTNTTWFGINVTDSVLQWAWNSSEQRLKIDPPKAGGAYTVKIGANSNSVIATGRFIINPYDVCVAAKTGAGTVDSSTSFYAWQYKTTDTVYFELKAAQANNPSGRANSTSAKNGTNFGMGFACSVDTTRQQVVTNATITVDKVFSAISGVANSLNSTETVCKADDSQGTYTCTLKPLSKWEGGRNVVEFSIVGSDRQTSDKVVAIFESRSFFIYGYPTTWANKPQSNITFTLNLYNPGTSWWNNYGSGGLSGSATIQKVQYMGKNGEWVWPPVEYPYNTTGVNASNITSGTGTFSLQHTRASKGSWDVGSYSVVVKATDAASGESDYGEVWFEIKRWDAYSTPVEKSGSSFNYKYSVNPRENVSLYVRLTTAGNYNDNGGSSLGGNVSVTVKRLEQYPKEVNSSSYGVVGINVNQSSPWYYNANADTYANYVITLYPVGGSWESGYYNAVLDINGTDTGWGWFNVISFSVQTQPTDENGTNYVYNIKGNKPAYFNVTASKSWKNSYTLSDFVNATLSDMVIRTWRQSGNNWQPIEYNYPEDINITVVNKTNLDINGSALLNVTLLSGNWPSGWYSGDVKLKSVSGENAGDFATGYIYFNVQPFRAQASVTSYEIDYDANVTANLYAYEPGWSSNTVLAGNYSIKKITESQWTGTGYNYVTYTNYTPHNFTGQTVLNISPSGATANNKWSLSNSGYRYLTITVEDSNTGDTQDAWLSFRAMPFLISVGTPYSQNSISSAQNVTIPVTITSSRNSSAASGNISRISEWVWPSQTSYGFTVGNCSSTTSGSCKITGTQNVTLHVPAGGWSEGWHYMDMEFTPPDDKSSRISSGSTWFRVSQSYTGSFSNYDENNVWKYYIGFSENVSLRVQATDANYVGREVNITKVEYAESGSSCWSDYCRTYVDASWQVVNANPNKPNETSAAGSVVRIIAPSGGWQRGDHIVRVNVVGPLGSATLKSGYFWVKDTSGPNVTIASPLFNVTINVSSFLFNVTTTEDSTCSFNIVNYDSYNSWYCGGSNASTVYNPLYSHTCNTTTFKGSSYYSVYASRWSDSNFQTDGIRHSFNFSTAGMPAQHYGAYLWCSDVDWNNIWAATVFVVNTSISGVNVTLTSPANNGLATSSPVNFGYSFTGPTSSCDLYTNSSGWMVNANQQSLLAGARNITLPLTNGTYIWNIKCAQTTNSSNFAWGASNRTLYVNITS